MANRYITLNGKRYTTTDRAFRPVRQKSLQVRTTLTGKTTSQQFAFTDYTWQVSLLVYLNATDPYGDIDDLRTAYSLEYCAFVDQFGVNQGNVFIEGELPEPYDWALLDESTPFIVSLSLRKRQT